MDFSLDASHDNDSAGDHGTHVAGIAAANAVEGSGVVGMAPDAQLVIMKVFGANGGAYTDDIVAALEDALRLGVDVVNMSLGSPAGFGNVTVSYDDPDADVWAWVNSVYDSIGTTGTIVNVSAGNEGTSSYGNMWGTDLNTTLNPDNATVSSPSTYNNINSIASVDNSLVEAPAINLNGVDYMYSETSDLYVTLDSLSGEADLEYVMVPGLGEASDFEGLDVSGKVAVIARGTINFSTKLANAEAAGAIAVLITNNVAGSVASTGMSLVDAETGELPVGVSGYVPCVLVSLDAGEALAAAADDPDTVLTVNPETKPIPDEDGGQVSYFSSWGVGSDLSLKPDMAGVGGNVYSTVDDGLYDYMSGTSMSSPQVAGMSALVKQYLEKVGVSETEIQDMTTALMMSTAVPVVDSSTGLEASPRQQGAGLVNVKNAVTSGAYLTVNGDKPKAELGDSANGTYSFTFEIHNFSNEDKTYTLSSSLMTEDYVDYGIGVYFMAGENCKLDGAVAFGQNTVTVSANGTASVTVTVSLSEAGKAWLDTYYPNGGYVEGYVYLNNANVDGVDLSLPFLGFYGDWTEAPIFDSAYWYDNTLWDLYPAEGYVDGDEYWHIFWTNLAGSNWVLGMNPYVGAYTDENGNVAYNSDNNVISNNGDGLVDYFDDIYLSLLRNVRSLNFKYTDEDGNVVHEETSYDISKTMYISAYGRVVPYIHSWYYNTWDFTYEDGTPIPSGTKLTLTITAVMDYEGEGNTETMVVPLTVDTKAPELANDGDIAATTVDGKNYITFTVADESTLAYAALMNPEGTQTVSEAWEFAKNEDGTITVTMDVTGFGTELLLLLADYGCNESYYDLVFTDEMPEGNEPVVSNNGDLYAYRVYDANIYGSYGYDYMFGWVNIDKETAEVTALNSDAYEYYALTAAEYVDGTIYAVDAGYNLVVMKPDQWFRQTIRNLGVNVVDMAFDDVTGTMYLVTKTEGDYGDECAMYTMDLTTGELTRVCDFMGQYYMPWAMTFVDGTLYAVKYYYAGLFTVDTITGEMTAVTDADGNKVMPKNSAGNNASPLYAQSMTYSKADGKIYWAFYTSNWSGETADLISIDVKDWTCTAVPFATSSEYVGLLTLEEDDYTLPEAKAMKELTLSAEDLVLIEGETAVLKAGILPWNYEPEEEIVWTSDDTSVATVEDGVVTAVSEGYATITASCEGVTVSCDVTVVDVTGTVHLYDYYDAAGNYGYWADLDLESMTMGMQEATPVDFIAADYNGHDGNVYGYDMNGQFYRYNRETGECTALGTPVSSVPVDLAYDYANGYMYAMTIDQMAWTSTLCYVNMNTGALVEVASTYDIYMTLACDMDGTLFAISSEPSTSIL